MRWGVMFLEFGINFECIGLAWAARDTSLVPATTIFFTSVSDGALYSNSLILMQFPDKGIWIDRPAGIDWPNIVSTFHKL